MMDSLNKQIEMQDMFNWRIKLTALEEQKSAIEHEIEKIKRILYGNSTDSAEKRGRKAKDRTDNPSGLSGGQDAAFTAETV